MASKWGDKWWYYALGIVLVLLVVVIVLSTMSDKPVIPEARELERIRAIPYDKETMNCQDKARLYAAVLKKAGYKYQIAIGKYDGKGHAWVVFVDAKNKRRLIDPTGRGDTPSGYLETCYDEYVPETYVDEIVRP